MKFSNPLEEYQYPLFGYVMTVYKKYSEGVLPYPGALADQPSKIIEIFNTIESVELEFKEKEAEDQKAKDTRDRRRK